MEASGINVKFTSINSKAYDVSQLELGLGQTIEMEIPALDSNVKWFADNDAVLSITTNGDTATITALKTGVSLIQVQSPELVLLKKISIEVVSDVAASLGMTASTPIVK